MLLSQVVQASQTVRATTSRKTKIKAFAELLESAGPDELAPVVAWVSGELTQGRIGTGWRTLTAMEVPAAGGPTLSVAAVDSVFSELAAVNGSGSTARRKELLTGLFAAATKDEHDFLIRLLTGEMRQGALTAIVAEAVAMAFDVPVAAVRRAHMLSGRLPATALAAQTGGAAALAAFRLEVGRPIQPMLASPGATLDTSLAEFGGEVSVEIKMDGARIQVHRKGDQVWVFTRTLRDITSTVPELVELVRGLDCTSVVLDGETLALEDSGRPRPFQETMSRFAADPAVAEANSTRELLLHPYFFDCLHLDGADLLDAQLRDRRDALTKVAGSLSIPALIAPDEEAAAEYFDGALAAGHEGIMIKSLAAPYAAGRRGRAWQKVKPTHTLDLVVLGAEWGYGRRTGYLSNLHLGARDPEGGEPIMVGKTFKGLTDALLQWQTAEFPRHERERDATTVYLFPELVVEIALDGVQTSPRYPGGVALRFARVLRYRPDKEPADADTIDTIRALLPGAPS
ncbi:ATP-dependent DNA ligase [Nocardia huaxiensis]|uniref:Probable DNA ligase n=1 Tax=Nocardia huaxiensis TaxID=2755382 RepID=A0A7D6ZKZ5_9NOCA|nr:ATP-dependent DNA ligase [Nocardia huaxiensis]QLY32180.1 ATP-dependent DNA ligase [Nocardia huaxiensis]UFS94120.1 ATP-dependent DNA ligase [Nocardia huaxiensis]